MGTYQFLIELQARQAALAIIIARGLLRNMKQFLEITRSCLASPEIRQMYFVQIAGVQK